MADTGVRIALLARAGKARDQLHRALVDSQANIVAEGDPADLDPEQVGRLAPTVYLVSLEPAIEAALDRFDGLLSGDGVEVMFDDAEVTARLDGWDLNRWARHLATKLLGSDALPTAPADAPAWASQESEELTPGAPPTPAQLMDGARLEDYTLETFDMAESVPASPSLTAAAEVEGGVLDYSQSAPAELALATNEQAADRSDSISFDQAFAGGLTLEGGLALVDFESDAALPVVEAPRIAVAERAPATAAAGASASADGMATVTFDFSNLMLAPLENATHPAPAALAASPAAAGEHQAGAVLILAGLGGPDAVRQLLSSLSETLPVPVLLYQHLEVGKHERLVDQLAKISRLPVLLAAEGETATPGKVSLLPAGMTALSSGGSLVFASGSLSGLVAALTPADSVVVVLSGADAQLVPAILDLGESGGLVLAQDPEVCFDAGAAEAMQAKGAAVYPALGLARQIAARWSP